MFQEVKQSRPILIPLEAFFFLEAPPTNICFYFIGQDWSHDHH